MKSTDDRKLFGTPIGSAAAAGNIAAIPQTQASAGDGTASVALGFPPETFVARAAGGEPPRGQDMNGLLNLLSSAMQVLQAGFVGPFDTGFAQSIGGYPAGAIVAGVTPGAFWVSTADANVSTPGASGATWQSLFNGYATQAWANGQFLQLALATAQSVTGPVAFGSGVTVQNATLPQNPVPLGQVQAMGFIGAAFLGVTVLTSSATFTHQTATKWLHIRACGAGGGGGGVPGTNSGNQASAGGGQCGQYIDIWVPAVSFGTAPFPITIGAGGPGGAGTTPSTNGVSGGNTVIGSLVTLLGGAGGTAGQWGAGQAIYFSNHEFSVPIPSLGTIISALPRGTGPGLSFVLGTSGSQSKGGDGGSTPLGSGGPGAISNQVIASGMTGGEGGSAVGYGAGGGGASVGYNAAAQYGGAGASGIVIIEEYC